MSECLVPPEANDDGPGMPGAHDSCEGGFDIELNLEIMDAHHKRLLGLCDQLETLADSLPDSVDINLCLRTARVLVPAVRAAHRFEEGVFFPMVSNAFGHHSGIEETLRHLRGEHREDEGFAEETAEALMEVGAGTDRRDSEATGYMLRGLFETLRRHIAFERTVLTQSMPVVSGPAVSGPVVSAGPRVRD